MSIAAQNCLKALNAILSHSFWEAICLQRYMQCVDSRFLFATFLFFRLHSNDNQPCWQLGQYTTIHIFPNLSLDLAFSK